MPVLFLEGITDRTQAESLVRAILLVEIDQNETTDEPDAWYIHQLIGLVVYQDDLPIGKVIDVDTSRSQHILKILHSSGEVLVPFVRQLVPSVDISRRRIEISPPDGLLPSTSTASNSEL